MSWSPTGFAGDVFGTAPGGSLQLVEDRTSLFNGYTLASQCVNTTFQATGWQFFAWVRVFGTSPQDAGKPIPSSGSNAEAILQFYESPGCAGPVEHEYKFGTSPTAHLQLGNTYWKPLAFGGPYDLTAKSVRVSLAVIKRLPLQILRAYFDDVFLGNFGGLPLLPPAPTWLKVTRIVGSASTTVASRCAPPGGPRTARRAPPRPPSSARTPGSSGSSTPPTPR